MEPPYFEDRKLVQGLLAGDERSFQQFFDDHFDRLFRFALPRLGFDHDAAEDVVQETLSKALGKIATFRAESSLFSWMCTFCRHEISRWHRRHATPNRLVPLNDDNPEVLAAIEKQSRETDPRRATMQQDLAQTVHEVLDLLPSRYADCLQWKYTDGISVNQIAERLGVGFKAAESLLTRAREAFRTHYETLTRGRETTDGIRR